MCEADRRLRWRWPRLSLLLPSEPSYDPLGLADLGPRDRPPPARHHRRARPGSRCRWPSRPLVAPLGELGPRPAARALDGAGSRRRAAGAGAGVPAGLQARRAAGLPGVLRRGGRRAGAVPHARTGSSSPRTGARRRWRSRSCSGRSSATSTAVPATPLVLGTLACLLRPELVPFLGALLALGLASPSRRCGPLLAGALRAPARWRGSCPSGSAPATRSTAASRRAASPSGASRWPSSPGCARWSACTTTPACRWSCWPLVAVARRAAAPPLGGARAGRRGARRGGARTCDDPGRLLRQPALRAAGARGGLRAGRGRRGRPGSAAGRRRWRRWAPPAPRRARRSPWRWSALAALAARPQRRPRCATRRDEVGVRMEVHRDLARAVRRSAGGAEAVEPLGLGHHQPRPAHPPRLGARACRWSAVESVHRLPRRVPLRRASSWSAASTCAGRARRRRTLARAGQLPGLPARRHHASRSRSAVRPSTSRLQRLLQGFHTRVR